MKTIQTAIEILVTIPITIEYTLEPARHIKTSGFLPGSMPPGIPITPHPQSYSIDKDVVFDVVTSALHAQVALDHPTILNALSFVDPQ
jgi:hypothetical protein